MKVVHLESGRHLYGGARQVDALLSGLTRQGVDNVLICRPDAALKRARPAARVVDVPWHGDLDWGAARRVRAVLRRERPDLVHVHSRAGADVFGALAACAERLPALLTRRVDNREPARWARRKFRRFARIVAISSQIHAWLVGELGLAPAQVAQITSAVDPARFAPRARARRALVRRFALAPESLIVAAVGQLIPRKGHDVLLAALPQMLAQAPAAHVLIFGRGPAAASLRASIARHGLDRRVRLAGFEPDLAAYLAGVDVLVHPARAEGLGLAVLEASSCAVPVVASRVGGLVDAVVDGQTGLLVPPEEPAALAAATLDLLAAPRRRQALGRAGRAHVRASHGITRMTDAYLRLYEELVGHVDTTHRP